GVGTVEVHGLRRGFVDQYAVLVALDVVQAGVAHEADRLDAGGDPRVVDEGGGTLHVSGIVVEEKVRARGAQGAIDDGKDIGDLDVTGLVARIAGRRVGHFVDAVLMVVGGEEDNVLDLVVNDELEQGVALGAVAADIGLAAIGADRAVGGVAAVRL